MEKQLQTIPINTRIKLAFLWTSMIGLWIYADFFQLFTPFKLKNMLDMKGPFGETTPETLVYYSILLILPTLMIAGSILLKSVLSKWINIIMALFYTLISVLILFDSWGDKWLSFYILYQIIEIFVFALIVWYAWNWPSKNQKNSK
ncbi:MAG TPA: hypothetical protein DDX98_02800 [Bacteroidales bacterium]|jgi:hypothetical protein|nr:hypothetical protein [Bacteroidales bacterium]